MGKRSVLSKDFGQPRPSEHPVQDEDARAIIPKCPLLIMRAGEHVDGEDRDLTEEVVDNQHSPNSCLSVVHARRVKLFL